MKLSKTRISHLTTVIYTIPVSTQSSIVYSMPCSCGKVIIYIGEKQSVKEHQDACQRGDEKVSPLLNMLGSNITPFSGKR